MRKKLLLVFTLLLSCIVFITGCGTEDSSVSEQLTDNNSVSAKEDQSKVDETAKKKIKFVQSKKLEAIPKKKLIGEDTAQAYFEPNLELARENDKLSIHFTVKNISGEPRNLTFSSGQEYDFFVYNSKNELIYQWSEGKMFTQAIKELTLEDGDGLTFNTEWGFIDKNGMKVSSDEEYRIEFMVTAKVTTEKGEIVFPSSLTATKKIQANK